MGDGEMGTGLEKEPLGNLKCLPGAEGTKPDSPTALSLVETGQREPLQELLPCWH